MAFRNQTIDSAVALGSSGNGTAVKVDRNRSGFSIAAIVSSSSSLNTALKLQASLDPANPPASTSWGDITGMSQTITADGCYIYDVAQRNWQWIRLVNTNTGGTGNVTTTFNENE